jgi:hypothetical protein
MAWVICPARGARGGLGSWSAARSSRCPQPATGRLQRAPDGTLGLARPEAEAEAARWTLDALAHAAQAQGIMVGRRQVRRV